MRGKEVFNIFILMLFFTIAIYFLGPIVIIFHQYGIYQWKIKLSAARKQCKGVFDESKRDNSFLSILSVLASKRQKSSTSPHYNCPEFLTFCTNNAYPNSTLDHNLIDFLSRTEFYENHCEKR